MRPPCLSYASSPRAGGEDGEDGKEEEEEEEQPCLHPRRLGCVMNGRIEDETNEVTKLRSGCGCVR